MVVAAGTSELFVVFIAIGPIQTFVFVREDILKVLSSSDRQYVARPRSALNSQTWDCHLFPKIFFSRSGPNSLMSSSIMLNGRDTATREKVAPTPRSSSG
jgi:hypothetical protein